MKETLPKSVQELILSLREKLKDEPEIVDMFERCYSNRSCNYLYIFILA